MTTCILVFGSLAREQADSWSDIDLLVVTRGRAEFGTLFTSLTRTMPIAYRSTFSPEVEPSGGRVLGIVFEGESVFHNLDLNFLTNDEYELADALERFGFVKPLYIAAPSDTMSNVQPWLMGETEHPDEKRIADGLHFTKKNLKRVLRGQNAYADLRQHAEYLRRVLNDRPFTTTTPRGNIMAVAEAYLSMADDVIQRGF